MLRKLALAVGAVAICGAVQARAGISFNPHQGGDSFKGDFNKGNDGYKGDTGDNCGCVKIIVPKFDSNCDVAKWIQTLDCKENSGNVFDELVSGQNAKDLGFCLPKSEEKILDDLQSDIKDVGKDFDQLSKDDHGNKGNGNKGGDDIKCDLTDIRQDVCDFASGLKDLCHPDHDCNPVAPTVTAVPLPAAASQGLIGMGLLGCLGMAGAVRRRVFARA